MTESPTPCLHCIHLAPIKRIPAGDPREIQVDHQGMLARGMAYCALVKPGQTYRRYRSLTAQTPCADFEACGNAERIQKREALAERLQRDFHAWLKEQRRK